MFYNEYDDLRTIEITPVTFLPLRWGNLMEGSAYGFEAWAEHSDHALVAPFAGRSHAAQAPGVQRRRVAAS